MKLSRNWDEVFVKSKLCFHSKKVLFLLILFCFFVLYCLSARFLQPKCLNLKEENLLNEKLKVDLSTSPKVDLSTSPKVGLSTSPKVDLSTSPKVDLSTSPKVDLSTSPKVDLSTSPKVDLSTSPSFSYKYIHRIKRELLYLFEFINEDESLSQNENLKKELLQRQTSLVSITDNLIDEISLESEPEAKSLELFAQQAIYRNQEPEESCDNRRKLIVRKMNYCGIGCVVHHLAKCFLIALGTNRTFLIEDSTIPLFVRNVFHDGSLFQPISRKCSSFNTESVKGPEWEGSNSEEDGFEKTKDRDVICTIVNHGLHRSTPFSFHTIPKPFKESLERFHGNPAVWWSGQVLSYLLRLQPETLKSVEDFRQSLNFSHPIVGIHVRRTDKVKYQHVQHQLEIYMMFTEEWFRTLEWKESRKQLKPVTVQRRVYLATDEPAVAVEFRQKYPNYQLIHDEKVTEEATMKNRQKVGPEGIVKDIFTLIECDYLVLGYESNVGRLVYPLLQTKHVDASEKVVGLGWPYHHLADYKPHQIAIANHIGKDGELSFIVGDVIDRDVRAPWKRGYWTGTNRRTKEKGVYPAFKVILHQFTAPYQFRD